MVTTSRDHIDANYSQARRSKLGREGAGSMSGAEPQAQSCVADFRHRIRVRAVRRRRAVHQRDHVPGAAAVDVECGYRPPPHPARACSSRSGLYMETMRVLGILTYRVEGAERLREPGRLIVANHPTLIDVVLLVSLMPEVDCIVKRGSVAQSVPALAGLLGRLSTELRGRSSSSRNARRRCGAAIRCWCFPRARAPCRASRCACSAARRTSRSPPTRKSCR